MLTQALLSIVLSAGLLVGTAWADDSLNAELNRAIGFENIAKVEELIAKGADVNAMGSSGIRPLHSAVIGGKNDMAELLIAKGADVKAKDSRGNTLLHDLAVIMGKRDMAELLIAKGADVKAKGQNGNTPLHAAAIAFKAPKDVAELFIVKGADVNAKNSEGITPLQAWELKSKPVWWVNKDVIELLIANGAK